MIQLSSDKPTRQGELAVMIVALIGGAFPIFSYVAVREMNGLSVAFWLFLSASLWLTLWLAWQGQLNRMWSQIQVAWRELCWLTFYIIVCSYGLKFVALESTSALNVALLGLTEVFWGLVVFGALGLERWRPIGLIGAVLALLGTGLIIYQPGLGFNPADGLVLLATLCASLGNIYLRRVRDKIDTGLILWFRCAASVPVFALLGIGLGSLQIYVPGPQLLWLAGGALLFFVLEKVLWIEAIHRIAYTKAIALAMALGTLAAVGYAAYFLGEFLSGFQLWGTLPLFLGSLLMLHQNAGFLILRR